MREAVVREAVRVWWRPEKLVRGLWAAAGVVVPVRVACWGRFVVGAGFGARWLLVGPRGRLVGAPSCAVRVVGRAAEWERAWKSAGGGPFSPCVALLG